MARRRKRKKNPGAAGIAAAIAAGLVAAYALSKAIESHGAAETARVQAQREGGSRTDVTIYSSAAAAAARDRVIFGALAALSAIVGVKALAGE